MQEHQIDLKALLLEREDCDSGTVQQIRTTGNGSVAVVIVRGTNGGFYAVPASKLNLSGGTLSTTSRLAGVNSSTTLAANSQARLNSQGPMHASPTGIAHASPNSVLARGAVASTALPGLTTGLNVQTTGGTSLGTVSRVVTARHDIPSYVCIVLSLGTLLLAPIVLLSGSPLAVRAPSIPIAIFLALTGSALFTYLFYFAMRRIGALRVGAILATSAAFGVTIAVAFGFPLTALQAVGGAVMACGVVALYMSPSPKG